MEIFDKKIESFKIMRYNKTQNQNKDRVNSLWNNNGLDYHRLNCHLGIEPECKHLDEIGQADKIYLQAKIKGKRYF